MSVFGQGTFRQRLLEHIIDECARDAMDLFEGVEATMEVVSEIARTASRRDDSIKKLYAQARADARQELVAKLNEAHDGPPAKAWASPPILAHWVGEEPKSRGRRKAP